MKIALAQIDCIPGDIEANCSRIMETARQAGEQGCGVLFLPELVDTGYEMRTVERTASVWPGLPFNTTQNASRNNSINIICGLSERQGDAIYNSLAVFSPDGSLIGKYRKTHLIPIAPIHEDRYITPGNSLELVEIGGINWGLLICYDLRFPEISRALTLMGCHALAVCASWPFPREAHWMALARARAIENQSHVIACNRVGTDGPLTFCGSSCVINAEGKVLAQGSQDREEIIMADINAEEVDSIRAAMPVLKGRRQDLYHSRESEK
ncbi:MAG: nitrilase-related carbon-nitrogen hydrolase [Dehalococcoidia bacterium]